MRKQISTEQNSSNIREVVRLLSEAPATLDRLSKKLSKGQLRQPLGTGERSFTETVSHLIHCETVTADSIFLALLRDEPILPDIHAERDLGKLLRFDLLPTSDLLAYFKIRRMVLLRVLESLTEKKWSRRIREVGKARKESVYWRARGQALHEMEHIMDLDKKMSR